MKNIVVNILIFLLTWYLLSLNPYVERPAWVSGILAFLVLVTSAFTLNYLKKKGKI